uniref:Uncharacterized protein n=1 Tax=Euplotes harpa TaxID=151035 RepID=A0A7S3N7N8_9SPIT|mmetsp:Transcript_20601/g.23810  ORF Transcript_20601/g.23810 Transcript_20601/m.23810 type:complete len:104 (+) Transcript_20601:316-627(+)
MTSTLKANESEFSPLSDVEKKDTWKQDVGIPGDIQEQTKFKQTTTEMTDLFMLQESDLKFKIDEEAIRKRFKKSKEKILHEEIVTPDKRLEDNKDKDCCCAIM